MHGKYLQSIVGILHVCNICLLLSNTSSAWSLRAFRMTNVLYAKALAISLAFWAEFNRDDPRRDGMSVQLFAKVVSTGDRSFLWFNKKLENNSHESIWAPISQSRAYKAKKWTNPHLARIFSFFFVIVCFGATYLLSQIFSLFSLLMKFSIAVQMPQFTFGVNSISSLILNAID